MNKEDILKESIRVEKAMNQALKEDKLKKAKTAIQASAAKPKVVVQNI